MSIEKAVSYMQQGEWQQALDIFNEILMTDKSNEQALINSAILLSKSNHLKEAEQLLQYALVHHPNSALTIATLANIYYDEGRFQEAIILYQRALVLTPTDSNILYMLGRSLLNISEPKLALVYLQSAHELDLKDNEIKMQLALCYCQLNIFDCAMPLLQELTEIIVYQADAKYNLALSYYYIGERLQAIQLLEAVVNQYPEHLLASYALKRIESENIK